MRRATVSTPFKLVLLHALEPSFAMYVHVSPIALALPEHMAAHDLVSVREQAMEVYYVV